MVIRCEHVHRLKLRKSFIFWASVCNVASVPKAPFISYSHISFFWKCMSENIFRPYFSLNWQMRNTKFKKKIMQF